MWGCGAGAMGQPWVITDTPPTFTGWLLNVGMWGWGHGTTMGHYRHSTHPTFTGWLLNSQEPTGWVLCAQSKTTDYVLCSQNPLNWCQEIIL